jgi:hypothetical protein
MSLVEAPHSVRVQAPLNGAISKGKPFRISLRRLALSLAAWTSSGVFTSATTRHGCPAIHASPSGTPTIFGV